MKILVSFYMDVDGENTEAEIEEEILDEIGYDKVIDNWVEVDDA